MANLNVRLFGPGVLTLDGEPIRPHSAKTLALLAFLAVESAHPHTRAKLAALLWGGYAEAAGKQSLRQALYSLKTFARKSLHDCLHAEHELVRFAPGAGADIDVHRFLTCVHGSDREQWVEAAALYRAPLLEGQRFDECEEFEAWLIAARERLHALAVQNLERLVLERTARADLDAALGHAEALRALDPLSESASRHRFKIFAARGDRRGIEVEWTRLCEVFQRELGVRPSRQTEALYRALRDGESIEPAAGASHVAVPGTSPATAAEAPREAGTAEPLIRAGRAAERVYAFGHALELYERALGILRQAPLPSPDRVCEALILKESVLERLGRRAEQMATVDEAVASAESLGDQTRLATVLLRKASVCAYLGDEGAARDAAERALDLYRTAADRPGEAEALRELGFLHWRAGDYSDALRCAREALALHRSLGDVAGEGTALHNLAEIHRGLGSPKQALQWYGHALQLHWAAKNHAGEILTLFGMANALHQAGNLSEAKLKYEAALALSERYGERTMQSRALHALAMHCRAHGALADALRFMQRAIEVDRGINYAHALGHDLVDLSIIHAERGERLEAGAALQEAAVWFGFIGDHAALASIRERLSDLEVGRAPVLVGSGRPGWVKSHLPLAEGKVYCEFESPVAGMQRS